MKTSRLLLAAAALMAAGSLHAAATVGEPAPDFTATSIDGRSFHLAELKGRTVVLEWTNPECPFVRKHYESGNIPRLQQAAKDDGIVWLSVNSGHAGAAGDFDRADIERWQHALAAAPAAYIRDRDGSLGRLYGARTTPHIFVIGGDGTLVYAGAIDSIRSADQSDIASATNYVKTTLTALKEGRPVKPAATQPYGCNVHY